VKGRQKIVAFLRRKWTRALDYRLIKELWAFEGNHIAVRFAYDGTTTPELGFAPMAMRIRSSMRTRLCA